MKLLSFRFFLSIYTVTLFLLGVYSYSQVDLNLTLSNNSWYQLFQTNLTYLGYFNRPLSALIFIILVIMLFVCYGWFLWLVKQKEITEFQFWLTVGITALIGFFSYTAFSHDLFNYIFDVRIIAKYGDNPYVTRALDYPDDLWVRFMHWTHRTYPYGPLWLVITLPLYLLGLGKFVLTMGLFKLLFVFTYIGTIFFIKKLTYGYIGKHMLSPAAFFALNPLIIIESLVSPHLDSVMLFFALLGVYFFMKGKKIFGSVFVFASFLIKFITGILLPLFFIAPKLSFPKRMLSATWLLLGALLIPIMQREPYPWYFVPVIGFASLTNHFATRVVIVAISLATTLNYAPYLYIGDYINLVSTMQWWIAGVITAVTSFILLKKYMYS